MKKLLTAMLLIVITVTVMTAIVQASYPVKVQDDFGRVQMVPRKPMRIVSLSPSHTEILFAIGVGDRVVGRTDFCDYPKEVAKVPSVGGYSQPSVETIMALKPDLVLASFGNPKELIDQLRNLGVPVVGYNPETFADLYRVIWEIGKVTDAEGAAVLLVEKMKDRVKAVQNLVKNAPRPLVFWEVWHDPLYTSGGKTFINDLIVLAGGVNVAASEKAPWPVYNLEMLLLKNPDVYIATKDQWANPGDIPGRPGFSQLKAVKNGRVYIINANNVNRPSPRLIDGLDEVVRVIHPELFK